MKRQHAIFLWALAIVGTVEVLVHFLLPILDLHDGILQAVVDAGLLLAISTPLPAVK